MTDWETAWAYCSRDRVHFANLLEILRRRSGEIKYAGDDGVLIYERCSTSHMMSAATPQAADRLLGLLPEGCKLLTGHEDFYLLDSVRRLKLGEAQLCFSALYEGGTALAVPSGECALRPLERSWASYVLDHYSHSPGGLDFIEGAIDRGMVGAFAGESLAGFVGFHEEGSIGLLEVLPAYRRRGLGKVLEAAAVNLALERGQLPFGQIIEGNEASLALQRRLGFTVSKRYMFWLF